MVVQKLGHCKPRCCQILGISQGSVGEVEFLLISLPTLTAVAWVGFQVVSVFVFLFFHMMS